MTIQEEVALTITQDEYTQGKLTLFEVIKGMIYQIFTQDFG